MTQGTFLSNDAIKMLKLREDFNRNMLAAQNNFNEIMGPYDRIFEEFKKDGDQMEIDMANLKSRLDMDEEN